MARLQHALSAASAERLLRSPVVELIWIKPAQDNVLDDAAGQPFRIRAALSDAMNDLWQSHARGARFPDPAASEGRIRQPSGPFAAAIASVLLRGDRASSTREGALGAVGEKTLKGAQ